MMQVNIRKADKDDVPLIRSLADAIWHDCYPSIISLSQIDYMLELMYSESTLIKELSGQAYEYYLVSVAGKDAGYMGLLTESGPDRTKLCKLYLGSEYHGRGVGRQMIEFSKACALGKGSEYIYLQVNKGNVQAINAYKRCGFVVEREAKFDIGNGFVMDDYVMSCQLDGYIRNPHDCEL